MKSQLLFLLLIISLSTHAQITTDGTLGPALNIQGPDYQIGPNLGQQRGGNLFHSFQDFNLQGNESATFYGPNHIQNVISRVTGGNPSNINGLFRSTIEGADVYFLNPYGILFGPNARLDVQGSFHASTADYLRFFDGGRFDARNPGDSLLTVAPVEAFGFFSPTHERNIAPISVQGHGEVTQDWKNQPTGLNVPEGKTLSLIGGKIEMWMGTFFRTVDDKGDKSTEISRLPSLSAPYGRINLTSVSSQGEVKLGNDFVDVSSFSQFADIQVTEKSLLQTSGKGGGSIFIRGGQFFADDSAIEAKTLGSEDGGVIDIRTNSVLLIRGATLNGDTTGTGHGTNIYVQTNESIEVIGENTDFDQIQESAIYARSGIENEFTGDDLGEGGQISLTGNQISFQEGARISTNTYGGGKGGDVILKAENSIIFIGEGKKDRTRAYLRTFSHSEKAGNAGNIAIKAKKISFRNHAGITTSTLGKGNAGTVTIHADDSLELVGVSQYNGSQIYVTAKSESTGGNAGNIVITAPNVLLKDGAYLYASSFSSGDAGDVSIDVGTLTIGGADKEGWRSEIASGSNPKQGNHGGKGGNIMIKADQLIVTEGGGIAASSIAPEGSKSSDGGNIEIEVQGKVELSGVNPYGENEDGFGAGIYARSHSGEADGDNAGKAGQIILTAGTLIIKDGAVIKSSTNNNAQGGNIEIDVSGTITITGDASDIPLIDYAPSQLEYHQDFSPTHYDQSTSGIFANSDSENVKAGSSGKINLTANELTITETGKVSTFSAGGGDAGTIFMNIRDGIFLSNESAITTEAIRAGGGDIQIKTNRLFDLTNGKVTTSVKAGTGDGGNITVTKPLFMVLNKGQIIAQADEGDGGNIRLVAEQFIASYDSLINASSKLGLDGNVEIEAPDENVTEGMLALSSDTVDASRLMKKPCEAMSYEEYMNRGRFEVHFIAGSPPSPFDLQPSGSFLFEFKPLGIYSKIGKKDNDKTFTATALCNRYIR